MNTLNIEFQPFGFIKLTHLADIDFSIYNETFDHAAYQYWLKNYHPSRYFLFNQNIKVNESLTITSTIKNNFISVYQPIDTVNHDWAIINDSLPFVLQSTSPPKLRIAASVERVREWCKQTQCLLGKQAYNIISLDDLV